MQRALYIMSLALLFACTATPTARLQSPACVGVDTPVLLDAHTSTSKHSTLERYRFDFGDGTPAVVGPNTQQLHRYRLAGNYEVALSVTDAEGAVGRAVSTVNVVQDLRGCGGPITGEPKIDVGVCSHDGVEDCPLDFGTTPAGTTVTLPVTVTNVGNAVLQVASVTLDVAESPFVLAVVRGRELAPGESLALEVSFSPTSQGRFGAKVSITSNASNNPTPDNRVVVELEGVTANTPFPRLELVPRRCDFGEVPLDLTGTCEVTMTNTGTAPLDITGLVLTDVAEVFRLFDIVAIPLVLPPGESRTIHLTFEPTSVRIFDGTLTVASNDALRPTSNVPLLGTGVEQPPLPVITIAFINGEPVTDPNPAVAPLDDVVLSGEGSHARRLGRTVVDYAWEVVSRPEVSRVTLRTPNAATTGFSFESSGRPHAGLDVTGVYVVQLNVTDSAGLRSSTPAVIRLNASPNGRLHMELTWTDDHSDMDLHLMRTAPGNFFTDEDCYFANCTQNSVTHLWSENPAAQPSLDVDDTTGFGPENISIKDPEPATYLVGVHYYNGHGDVNRGIACRVKVFVDGVTVLDETHTVAPCNSYWEVGRVVWGATNVTVARTGSTTTTDKGSCSTSPPVP